MIDEPLTQGASRIHALDPRHRLVACLGLSLAAVLAVTPAAPLVVLAVGLVLTAAARPRPSWCGSDFVRSIFSWRFCG